MNMPVVDAVRPKGVYGSIGAYWYNASIWRCTNRDRSYVRMVIL